MLHFEAVIGKVPLSTYFLGVLMTLQITLVCLTHLSEILCSSAHFSQILDLYNFLYHLEDELVGFNVISWPWFPLQLLQLFLISLYDNYVELASVWKKKKLHYEKIQPYISLFLYLKPIFVFLGA